MRRNLTFIRSPVKPTAQLTRLEMGELCSSGVGDVQSDRETGSLTHCRIEHQPPFAACSKQLEAGPGCQMYVTYISGLKAFAEMKSKMLHLFTWISLKVLYTEKW